MTPVVPTKLSRTRAKSLCMQARDGIERLAPQLDTHPLESLYATLKKHYNLVVAWAEESLVICAQPTAEHAMLGLDNMCPLLRLRRVSFSRRNIPIEFVLAWYNVRDFEFHLELRRS